MRERFLRWLVSWMLPGFHLHKDPIRKEPAPLRDPIDQVEYAARVEENHG